jgi:acetolactate synthase-1/2/3 large subunit
MTGGTLEQPLVASADLILGVGLDPVELIPRQWPYSCPVLYLGAWPHNARHFPATTVIGDIAASVRALGGAIKSPYDWDIAAIASGKQRQLDRLRQPGRGLAPDRLVELAREGTADEPLVTVDAGAHMFAVTNFWGTDRPNGFLISNGLASMGYALPAAIAASLLHRDERVLCFTGDGGLTMCLGELETLARLALNVTVVVFDDNTLSLIKIKQDQKRFTPSGVLFRSMDWRKIVEGLGCPVLSAADEPGFVDAWRQASRASGPVLVDAHIDPDGYGAMIAALRG